MVYIFSGRVVPIITVNFHVSGISKSDSKYTESDFRRLNLARFNKTCHSIQSIKRSSSSKSDATYGMSANSFQPKVHHSAKISLPPPSFGSKVPLPLHSNLF